MKLEEVFLMQLLLGFTGVRRMDVMHFVETKEMIKKTLFCELSVLCHNKSDQERSSINIKIIKSTWQVLLSVHWPHISLQKYTLHLLYLILLWSQISKKSFLTQENIVVTENLKLPFSPRNVMILHPTSPRKSTLMMVLRKFSSINRSCQAVICRQQN